MLASLADEIQTLRRAAGDTRLAMYSLRSRDTLQPNDAHYHDAAVNAPSGAFFESNGHGFDGLHKVRLHVPHIAIKLRVVDSGQYLLEHHAHFHFGKIHTETVVITNAKRTDIAR